MALTKIKSSSLDANAITTPAVVATLAAGQNIEILANGQINSTVVVSSSSDEIDGFLLAGM